MVGVLIWGSVHAFGAYYGYGVNTQHYNPWRAVVMIAFTVGFVEFWLMMLLFRSWRLKRKAQQADCSSKEAEEQREASRQG